MLAMSVASVASGGERPPEFYPAVRAYLEARRQEFDQIPAERRSRLHAIAQFLQGQIRADRPARLVFICTHNSRRSQMCQIWADVAAGYFGVSGVESFSGGTEVTSFNPHAVAALQRAGLEVSKLDSSSNPRYAVRYREAGEPLRCFSKVYDERPNPVADFCAILTCSSADESCPVVKGSSSRVAIPYEDPRFDEGTTRESRTYDERAEQICREMLYVFARLGG